jgi:hypothetical protein
MDHGRACFSLLKHGAAVWTTYDGHGQLLSESVRPRSGHCLRRYKAGGGGPVGAAWFQSPD